MPSNKNQHFVPKAYLRPFANGDGSSINLYAIKSEKFVDRASIKGQCSRPYFYGKQEVFDEYNRYLEGKYGGVLSRILSAQFKPADCNTLMSFFTLQYLRTPHMLEQRENVFDAFRNTRIAGKALHEIDENAAAPIDPAREMQHQIYIAAKSSTILNDLRPLLLFNATDIPFVTSDNPAVVTNRLYTQRYRDETAGLIQSGIAVFLPLTPRLAFLGYDSDVYSEIEKSIVLRVDNRNDIHRINQLQAQAASNVLYFSNWIDRDYVSKLAREMDSLRRDKWNHIWRGILEREEGEYEVYRREIDCDADSAGDRITSVSPFMAAPKVWPTFLNYKLRSIGYTTGSVVGFVRGAHAKSDSQKVFKQIKLPPRIPPDQSPLNREKIWMRKGG